MFKNYDYKCTNKGCPKYNIKEEILVKDKDKDNQLCKECTKEMSRGFGVGGIRTGDNGNRIN